MPLLRPPNPGDPIRAADMAAIMQFYNTNQFPTAGIANNGLLNTCSICYAHNVGAVDLNVFDVAIISGNAIGTTGTAEIAVDVAQAIADDNMGHACIVLDSMAAGKGGRVIVAGIFWANADAATTGKFATPIQGSSVLACSDVPGPFQVLAGEGTAMALVRFPLPAQNDHYQYLVLNSQATTYLPGLG